MSVYLANRSKGRASGMCTYFTTYFTTGSRGGHPECVQGDAAHQFQDSHRTQADAAAGDLQPSRHGVASRRSVHEAGLLALMYTLLHTLLQVQGEGIRNVYRVMPLINFKIPIGHKLTPQLEIYNPHDTV